MPKFWQLGAVLNLIALAGFAWWAIKAWKRADPKRHEEESKKKTD